MKSDQKYIDKNHSFSTNGNEYIDQVLCLLEANGVLSSEFKSRVTNIALWILTNPNSQTAALKESIEKLREEMTWLIIFSDTFRQKLCFLLNNGLNWETAKSN